MKLDAHLEGREDFSGIHGSDSKRHVGNLDELKALDKALSDTGAEKPNRPWIILENIGKAIQVETDLDA